jgi:hypothetical protein
MSGLEKNVIIVIKSKGLALQDMTLVGCVRLNYNGFHAKSLNSVVLAITLLQKYPVHQWGSISYLFYGRVAT